MNTLALSREEAQVLVALLEGLEERLGNDGCNDYDFPDSMSPAEVREFKRLATPVVRGSDDAEEDDAWLFGNNLTINSYFLNRLNAFLK
jgi:hypothetical protein